MSWTTFSAGSFNGRVCCLIFAPKRYDEPETLPYSIRPFCPMSADAGQVADEPFAVGVMNNRTCQIYALVIAPLVAPVALALVGDCALATEMPKDFQGTWCTSSRTLKDDW